MTSVMIKVPRTMYRVECHDKAGNLKWVEEMPNIVFDRAIEDMLGVYFKNQAQKPTWYLGLINTGASLLPTDTMASHPGWSENTNYTAGQRPQAQFGVILDKRMSNALNKAIFTMQAPAGNIVGVFLVSDATKGGTNGMLYAAAAFSSVKNTEASDTITVSATVFGA
ncbi:MAG: hypothetical protein ACKOX6_00910 [Bdellovibrio sp.]